MTKRKLLTGVVLIVVLISAGLALPEKLAIPVQAATSKDWNHKTFWHAPWGKSGVHKGIDIFAAVNTPVLASTYGIVVFTGNFALGGKVIAVLGPKWRIHYYAHLNDITVSPGAFVSTSQNLGSVGRTGNAQGKPAHLHFSIVSLLPYLWRIDMASQGWKKAFFLDPSERLLAG